jgi:hypothetical protein
VPGTPAQAVAGLEQQHIKAALFEITGRRYPGKTTADYNDIN